MQNGSSFELRERILQLDRLEEALFDRPADTAIRQAMADIEAVNQALYQSIRAAIVRGEGRDALHPWLGLSDDASPAYDDRDALVSGVLQLPEPQGEIATLEKDMVFYQPTPARRIFDLLELCQLGKDDLLIDLGSGLGHVSLLTAICTPARSIGIERDAAYAQSATDAATALALERATFACHDLREADLGSGTVFYLYTPVTGALLEQVMAKLEYEAARRPIRIASLGPCTAMLARASWLWATAPTEEHRIALFHSPRHPW
jgi:Histone methylation protein DOT1